MLPYSLSRPTVFSVKLLIVTVILWANKLMWWLWWSYTISQWC